MAYFTSSSTLLFTTSLINVSGSFEIQDNFLSEQALWGGDTCLGLGVDEERNWMAEEKKFFTHGLGKVQETLVRLKKDPT